MHQPARVGAFFVAAATAVAWDTIRHGYHRPRSEPTEPTPSPEQTDTPTERERADTGHLLRLWVQPTIGTPEQPTACNRWHALRLSCYIHADTIPPARMDSLSDSRQPTTGQRLRL